MTNPISLKKENIHISQSEASHSEQEATLAKYAYIHQCLKEMESQKPDSNNPNVYYTVFKAMLGSFKNHEGLFKDGAKMLQNNQKFQQEAMKELRKLTYEDLPPDAEMDQVKIIEEKNQEIDAHRAILQANIDVTKQKASVSMANMKLDMQGETRMGAELSNYGDKLNSAIQEMLSLSKRN